MTVATSLSFWTPTFFIQQEKPSPSRKEAVRNGLFEWAERYLCLRPTLIYVEAVAGWLEEERSLLGGRARLLVPPSGVLWEKSEMETPGQVRLLELAIKVCSYATLILPLAALLIKLYYRYGYLYPLLNEGANCAAFKSQLEQELRDHPDDLDLLALHADWEYTLENGDIFPTLERVLTQDPHHAYARLVLKTLAHSFSSFNFENIEIMQERMQKIVQWLGEEFDIQQKNSLGVNLLAQVLSQIESQTEQQTVNFAHWLLDQGCSALSISRYSATSLCFLRHYCLLRYVNEEPPLAIAALLERLETLDQGLTEEIAWRKLLGNMFGLDYSTTINDTTFNVSSLSFAQEVGDVGNKLFDFILQVGRDLRCEELLQSLSGLQTDYYQKIVFVKAASHVVSLVRDREFLLLGNQGEGSGGESGIKVFRIASERFSPQAIDELGDGERVENFIGQNCVQALGGQLLYSYPKKEQSVNNCPWKARCNIVFSTLLMQAAYEPLRDMSQQCALTSLDSLSAELQEELRERIEKVIGPLAAEREVFLQHLMRQVKVKALQAYLTHHSVPNRIYGPDVEILKLIYQKAQAKNKGDICQLLEAGGLLPL